MSERKFIIFGVAGIVVALLAGAAAVWFLLAPPITREQSQQQGNGDITFKAETVIDGLTNPWDVVFLPDETLLFAERSGAVSKIIDGKKVLVQRIDDIQAQGEGGLTGMALDTDFANNKFLYTCYNSTAGDVRVVRWTINNEVTELSNKRVLIDGIPANQSGRHSGCRIKSAGDGTLWVGTGDAAQAANPQNLQSLGGKVLHVNRDGEAVEGNIEGGDKRIFSYGHRNIQGIALFDQPINGAYGYSIEHGSNEDDEVNLLVPGNFGWDPLPPYDESVSMTDKDKFPEAVEAIWSSGSPTIAPSGGSILHGKTWGEYGGALAMAVLKNQHLRLLKFDTSGEYRLVSEEIFFERDFGRIRSATMGSDGNLYLTTDNGTDDKIIRVTPQ